MTALDLHLPALQVALPLLMAPLTVLLKPARLAWVCATVTSAATFTVAIALASIVQSTGTVSYAMGSWPAPYGIELVVDSFSAVLVLVVTAASTAGLLIAPNRTDDDTKPDRQLFYATWLLALAGLCGIVISGDAFNIFVFMEISSLAMYVLIAAGSERLALSAVFKYLVMGTIGATFYLIGIGLIYMMTGTLNLADMSARLGPVGDLKPVLAAGGFITVGLALKAAVFPLHTWLPNAYTHAPHAVTTFFAACATKVSLYVMLRFDFMVFQGNLPGHISQFATFILPLALLAMVVPALVAVREPQLKRLLAYSSVAQTGYVLFGAGLISLAGLTGAVFHLFNHAVAKGTLFVAVACLATRGIPLTITGISGVASRMPWTMGGFTLAGLSLIGIPGTAGFISKWYLVNAALEQGAAGIALVSVLLGSSVLAVFYIWKIVEAAWLLPEKQPAPPAITEAPVWMLALLWSGAGLNIYFGLQPAAPLALASGAATVLLR